MWSLSRELNALSSSPDGLTKHFLAQCKAMHPPARVTIFPGRSILRIHRHPADQRLTEANPVPAQPVHHEPEHAMRTPQPFGGTPNRTQSPGHITPQPSLSEEDEIEEGMQSDIEEEIAPQDMDDDEIQTSDNTVVPLYDTPVFEADSTRDHGTWLNVDITRTDQDVHRQPHDHIADIIQQAPFQHMQIKQRVQREHSPDPIAQYIHGAQTSHAGERASTSTARTHTPHGDLFWNIRNEQGSDRQRFLKAMASSAHIESATNKQPKRAAKTTASANITASANTAFSSRARNKTKAQLAAQEMAAARLAGPNQVLGQVKKSDKIKNKVVPDHSLSPDLL